MAQCWSIFEIHVLKEIAPYLDSCDKNNETRQISTFFPIMACLKPLNTLATCCTADTTTLLSYLLLQLREKK